MAGYGKFYLTAKNGSNARAVKSALMEAMHCRLNGSDALSARTYRYLFLHLCSTFPLQRRLKTILKSGKA
jgi:hypothetical protein